MAIETDVATRLNALFERYESTTGSRVSAEAIHSASGKTVSVSSINRIRSCDSPKPSGKNLYPIAQFFGVSVDYFFAPEWEEILEGKLVDVIINERSRERVSAKAEEADPIIETSEIAGHIASGKGSYRFSYNSDANAPIIPARSMLTVDPSTPPGMGDFVVYGIGGRAIVGRYVPAANGELLRFMHDEYEEIPIDEAAAEYWGLVKQYAQLIGG